MKILHHKLYIRLAFLLLCSSNTIAQTTYDTTFLGWVARVTAPQDNDVNQDSSSIFVFLTGLRETGTDPDMLSNSGFHHPSVMLGKDWDGSVEMENGKHRPVYVTLLPNESWVAPQTLDPILTTIFERFRVKTNAINLIGFSRGGNAINRYAVWLTFNNTEKKYNRITTITTFRAAGGWMDPDNLPVPVGVERLGYFAEGGGKALIFEQINDLRDNDLAAAAMNEAISGSAGFYWTNYGDGTHDTLLNIPFAHDYNNITLSNPNIVESIPQKQQHSIPIPGNLSIYQWALLQGDTSLPRIEDDPIDNDNPTIPPEEEEREDDVSFYIKIYPNPVSDILRILDSTGRQIIAQHFIVLTIHGRTITQGKNSANVNVANLSKGMYIIRFLRDDVWHNRRFLKM